MPLPPAPMDPKGSDPEAFAWLTLAAVLVVCVALLFATLFP
jgi:hypothetical protein